MFRLLSFTSSSCLVPFFLGFLIKAHFLVLFKEKNRLDRLYHRYYSVHLQKIELRMCMHLRDRNFNVNV